MHIAAQVVQVDSLAVGLATMPDDEQKVDLLNELAKLSYEFSIPRSRSYAASALQLAKDIQYKPGEALATYRMSMVYNSEGMLDSAYLLAQKANQEALSLGDSTLYTQILIISGTLLGKLDDDSMAMASFYRALDIGEDLGDFRLSAEAANGLATINTGLGYYDQALGFLTKSLSYAEQLDDPKLIAKYCINLAILNDSTEDRRYFAEKALHVASSYPNMSRELAYANNTMGLLHYYSLDNLDSALFYKKGHWNKL